MARRGATVRVAALTWAAVAVAGLGTVPPSQPGSLGGDGRLPGNRPTAAGVLPPAAPAGTPADTTPAFADGRCTDPAASWMGTAWRSPLRWRFAAGSTPAYLGGSDLVRQTVGRAGEQVATGRTDCRLAPLRGIAIEYAGTTRSRAGVTRDARCGRRDGHSVVSFGPLPAGLLAVTCVWWQPTGRGDGRTVEADIMISDEPGLFLLDPDVTCADRYDLESALTHEFGHAFGLGHVAAASHPGEVMGDVVPPCDRRHRSLGRGDYEMLRRHYGRG